MSLLLFGNDDWRRTVKAAKIEHILLVCLCLLIVVPLLYIYRTFDTSTFTSWRWVFSGTPMLRVFFLLVPALLFAYALSLLPLVRPYAIPFLLVLAFASILPLWHEPEAVIDASRYFLQAKFLKEYGLAFFLKEWGRSIPAWTDMPLMPMLYGVLFSVLGEARIAIEAFNTFLFAMTVVLTYSIGKKLWDEETGLYAGLLLMGIPFLLTQVPLLLVDVPAMFFLALSVLLFMQAVEKGGFARQAAAACAIGAAIFTKYSVLPMLSVCAVITAIDARNDQKKVFSRALAVLSLSVILAGAVTAVYHDVFNEQLGLLRTYQLPALGRWQEGFVSMFLYQTHPFITGLALLGIYRAYRERDVRFAAAGWFVLMVVLLRITRMRYLVPLFPLFALMASYGLGEIRDLRMRKFLCLGIAASGLVISYFTYLPFLNGTSMNNLAQAGKYLDTLPCNSVEVFALPQRDSAGSTYAAIPLLDYFTNKNIVSLQTWPEQKGSASAGTSSLRFTWEVKKPPFYSISDVKDICAVALISDGTAGDPATKQAGREIRRFDLRSDVFRYRTIVSIAEKGRLSR